MPASEQRRSRSSAAEQRSRSSAAEEERRSAERRGAPQPRRTRQQRKSAAEEEEHRSAEEDEERRSRGGRGAPQQRRTRSTAAEEDEEVKSRCRGGKKSISSSVLGSAEEIQADVFTRRQVESAPNLNLIALAEQVDDDDKKTHCVQSFNKTEDEAKVLAHQIVDHRNTLEVCEDSRLTRMTPTRSCKSRFLSFMPAWQRPLGSDGLNIRVSHSDSQ